MQLVSLGKPLPCIFGSHINDYRPRRKIRGLASIGSQYSSQHSCSRKQSQHSNGNQSAHNKSSPKHSSCEIAAFHHQYGAVVTEINHSKSPEFGEAGQLSTLPPGVVGLALIIELSLHCRVSAWPSAYDISLELP